MSPSLIISSIVWLSSLAGIVIFIRRALPQLNSISEGAKASSKKTKEKTLLPSNIISALSWEKILHKPVVKLHILTLRAENKTSIFLERIRVRSNSNGKSEHNKTVKDSYWKELKKSPRH